ncbi:MAG: hypothetical protein U0836_20020 [Pirellulales bacterium]
MLTIFTIPKAFAGHIGLIQRNALESWRRLAPACQVILVGDEQGVAETAQELGLDHLPDVAVNEFGTPLVNSVFAAAERLARHELLAFVNTDILLLDDFVTGAARIPHEQFLLVGARCNLQVDEPLPFAQADWAAQLRARARLEGRRQTPAGMDYFVYRKGLWRGMPAFAVGRFWWDNWLVYSAASRGFPVVDGSDAVLAIHQDHDYAHPSADGNLRSGIEVLRNGELGAAGRWYTYHDAHWKLRPAGERDAAGEPLVANWRRFAKPGLRWARNLAERAGLCVEAGGWRHRSRPPKSAAA